MLAIAILTLTIVCLVLGVTFLSAEAGWGSEAGGGSMPRYSIFLRLLLIPVLALLLFYAFVCGPGRGPTLISGDDPRALHFHIVQMPTYGLLLARSCLFMRRSLLGGMLLASGMVARAILELHVSVLREVVTPGNGRDLGIVAILTLFYLITFILPASLCLDSFRICRFRRRFVPKGE